MNKILLSTAILLFSGTSAIAETWKARNELLPGVGPTSCAVAQDGYTYTLELDAGMLSMTGDNGRFFRVAVDQRGAIKHEFKSPNGGRFMIAGNAFTRDLVLQNVNTHCTARLVPK